MIQNKAVILFTIAYFTIGFFSFLSAQVLNQSVADSLIRVMFTEGISDSAKYRGAMDISKYTTAPKLSLRYAKQALAVATKLQNPKQQAAAWLNISQAYALLGAFEDALAASFKSIDLYQSVDSRTGISSGYLVLGGLYVRQGNFSTALRYYNQSVDIFRKEQDTTRLATALLNVSEVYEENAQYDSALLLLDEAKSMFQAIRFEVGEAYATGNSGILNVLQGDDEVGEEKIREAIAILQPVEDYYAIAQYQLSLAEIYQQRGSIRQAIAYAQQSWQMAEPHGLLEQMRNASERLSSLYAEQGSYEQAYGQQLRYLVLKDSLSNEEVVRNMADIRTEFEVAQKQIEIDYLNGRRKLQRVVQLGLILLSLLVIAVAWQYYRNYRTQKKANQQLSQQKEELHTQNEMLDALIATRERFFSIISHDLRGPVHAFHSLSLILKMHLKSKNYGDLPVIADHIEQSTLQLSMLLDNLLNWATNQQDNILLQPEQLSVERMANEVVSVFQIVAVTKQIQLDYSVPSVLYVWMDRNALFTVLRNLVNNALKFTPQGGEVKVTAEREGNRVSIQVTDNGIGMSPDKVATLFEGQGGENTWGTAGEQGVGLGLQLVQEFVSRSQGAIEVTSEPNQGTTFTVQLPDCQGQSGEKNIR